VLVVLLRGARKTGRPAPLDRAGSGGLMAARPGETAAA